MKVKDKILVGVAIVVPFGIAIAGGYYAYDKWLKKKLKKDKIEGK